MSDLVERLREHSPECGEGSQYQLLDEAASTILRLEEENEELRASSANSAAQGTDSLAATNAVPVGKEGSS